MPQPEASRRRPRWRTFLISLFGYGVALGCLVWVFSGIHWPELWRELRHADVRWILLAVMFQFASDVFHAWRWNLLLRPVARLRLWGTVRALYSGMFANEVLPLRPGELIRGYVLAAASKIPFSVVVSSIALERLLDSSSLAAAFFITMLFLPLPGYLIAGVRVMAGILAVAAFLLMLFLWRMPDRGARLPRFLERLRHANEGIRRMANVRTLVFCSAASLASWGMQALPYSALSKSYHLGLSIGAMMAVLILMRTATLVPTAPGNAGLLQMACVLSLGFFAIDKTRATGFSALIFLALTLPLLVGGAILVAVTGVRIHTPRRDAAELATLDSPGI